MSMNNNVIDMATSPLVEAANAVNSRVVKAATCGNAARALGLADSFRPKSIDIVESSIGRSLDSFGEVNKLPCYKVTCNLHSVNSAKPLRISTTSLRWFFTHFHLLQTGTPHCTLAIRR